MFKLLSPSTYLELMAQLPVSTMPASDVAAKGKLCEFCPVNVGRSERVPVAVLTSKPPSPNDPYIQSDTILVQKVSKGFKNQKFQLAANFTHA